MKPRATLDPIDEGFLSEIAELFRPIVAAKPLSWLVEDWLAHIFNVADRTIEEYIVSQEFEMPGLFKMAPTRPIQGYGYRTVRAGSRLWMRFDRRDPERIDVEVTNGPGKLEQIFQLSGSQWRTVRRSLRKPHWPPCRHRRRRPRHARWVS